MRVVSWRSRRALAVYGALVAGTVGFLSLPTNARTESACELLRDWARPYQGASVTFDDFARFDRPHRLAIFNAVTPAVRAALVQEQLRRFSQRPDLSAPQRASIAEALTLTTAALYERQPVATQQYREFWARTDKLFTTPEQRMPWFSLGTVNVSPAMGVENAGLTRRKVSFGWCECATDWDCFGGACGGGGGCTGWQGCGPQGFQLCTGLCF
jgi:hypothetical protein